MRNLINYCLYFNYAINISSIYITIIFVLIIACFPFDYKKNNLLPKNRHVPTIHIVIILEVVFVVNRYCRKYESE